MKPHEIRPQATQELNETVRRYNRERRGLGTRFLNVVEKAFRKIQEQPSTGSPWDFETRMISLMPQRFPYAIIFKEYESEILILAVFHLHRQEDVWHDRLEILEEE